VNKTLLLAEPLRRAYSSYDQTNAAGIRIMQIKALHNVSDERLDKVRKTLSYSIEAKELLKVIEDGWPNDKYELHPVVEPHFCTRNLNFYNDISLKGEIISLPDSLRADVKKFII